MFESAASHAAKYRPDIDGLRAIAVLGVVFFHAGFTQFRGGFVGVDIFYVISGYLITSLLAKDLGEDKFSIVSFYERRLRRIFPALFALLLGCIFVASVLFNPREMASFGQTLLATTFFVSNIYFWKTAHPLGYFDHDVNSKPLLHTWSLSVEEQFYFFFPLVLLLLFRVARKRLRSCVLLLTLISFALNLWATEHKSVFAFYWSIPRAWELLIGALLALNILPPVRSRLVREVVALLGLAAIISALFLPILKWPFPGYIALAPCLGTWLVIYTGEAGPSIVRQLLSFRPLVFIGVISYSLYLWHWPIIVFSRRLPFDLIAGRGVAWVLIASLLAALFSFEYVERPFRRSGNIFSRQQVFAFGAAACLVTSVFGALAYRSGGFPQRYDQPTRQRIAANLARMDDFDESCGNFRTTIHRLSDVNLCTLGSSAMQKVMFLGDSHVQQIDPVIRQLYASGALDGHGVVIAIGNGCLPDPNLNNTGEGFSCDAFSKFAFMRANREDIDTVYIGFSTWWTIRYDKFFCTSSPHGCGKVLLSEDEVWKAFLSDLTKNIGSLRARGKRVIVSLPYPEFDQSIPMLEMSNAVFGPVGFASAPKDVTSPLRREQLRAAATNAGAEIFDPRLSLCRGGQCRFEIDGVSIYKDSSHLTPTGARILTSALRQALRPDLENPYEHSENNVGEFVAHNAAGAPHRPDTTHAP